MYKQICSSIIYRHYFVFATLYKNAVSTKDFLVHYYIFSRHILKTLMSFNVFQAKCEEINYILTNYNLILTDCLIITGAWCR